MKKLKIAVVGLGRVGWQFHIPEILKHKGFELVAVVDPLAERLEEAKVKFLVEGFTDYIGMLEQKKPDLVVIASPTPFHFDQTISAFERGVDVFLEKPMVPTLEEADRLIEAMQKTRRKLMVYQPHRVTPELLATQSIIERGILGPIYMVKRAITLYTRRNDWQSQKKFGGGMLSNYGAHYIDQTLFLTGSTAKSVSCSMRRIASLGDADDVVKAVIETENGIIIDLDINMAAAIPMPLITIMGARGTAVCAMDTEKRKLIYKIRYYNEDELQNVGLQTEFAAPGRSYSNGEAIKWYDVVVDTSEIKPLCFYDKCYEYYALDKEPFVPVKQTREVLRVMEECRAAAKWD